MFTRLRAYQLAFGLAMEIFYLSRKFPVEEKYSLTDQIRRSSRSVCANIGEAYRKRQYKAHFISKLSDSDMENTETQVWLRFALECNYINTVEYEKLMRKSSEIGRIVSYMIKFPSKFLPAQEK